MNDAKTTLELLKKQAEEFVIEREWDQFHTLKNLAMVMSIESNELMEHFLWVDSADSHKAYEENKAKVEHELADVLLSILCFANRAGIDIARAFDEKMKLNRVKYPVDKARGSTKKYDQL